MGASKKYPISDPEKQQPIPDAKKDKGGKEKKKMTPEKKSSWLMGCGAVTVVIGAVAVVFWPALFYTVLKRLMVVTPTSQSFNIWRHPDIPMLLEFHLFNITNVDEILAGKDVKINVVQMGPYVYLEDNRKVNYTWKTEDSTVEYYLNRTWKFVPEMSNGTESDMVTSINPIIATVAFFVRHQPAVIKFAADVMLRTFHDNLFLTANVSDWCFEGVDDELLDVVKHFPDFPINIPFDKFGWFYTRNGSLTYDGEFEMNTGAKDFKRLGQVEKWKGSNTTVFRGECGKVQGSSGELWVLEPDQEDVVIFSQDICSSLTLHRNRSREVLGIKGTEFASNTSLFDNGWKYPERACFCSESRDACPPIGLLNVSSCRYGAPAFVSLPHFYHVDTESEPNYPGKINGLNPLPTHNFRITLEPYTGIPLSVSAQLQINLQVKHIADLSIVNQLKDPDVMVPMFWFRQEIEMTPEYARLAQLAINTRNGMPIGLYVLTAIGLALLVSGIVILVRKIMRSPDTMPILEQEETQ